MGCRHTQRLNNDVIHHVLQLIESAGLIVYIDTIKHTLQGSLTTHIIVIFICVLDEILVVLVDGVVGQMHVQVGDIVFMGLLVSDSGEPRKAVSVYVNSERGDTVHENIDSEIVLEPID